MENNCKHLCLNCQRFGGSIQNPCVIDQMSLFPIKYPEIDMNECNWYMENIHPVIDTGNIEEENKSEINFINKNKDDLNKMEKFEPHVDELPRINIVNKETGKTLTDEEYKEWKNNLYKKIQNTENKIYEAYGLKKQKDGKIVDKDIETPEDMLLGETSLDHLVQVTSWTRVLNAARKTVGKSYLDKEPSMSWKARVLLAEHSPIRLLEYDFGWKKIRQWVTAHMVRHHEGCEKFVHSQRGDRRELPCDRDHIYQGAKNDMDMTCNAQAMINISRKRLCNCASKETHEAWKMVMDELQFVDPILRHKCVPECIYRGFCPELQSCGYSKTDAFKKQLAEYRNTRYGKDIAYYVINENHSFRSLHIIVSDKGEIYEIPESLVDTMITGSLSYKDFENLKLTQLKYTKHNWYNGEELCIENPIIPISSLVYGCFSNDPFYVMARKNGYVEIMPKGQNIVHIDGNIFNNDLDNLKDKMTYKGKGED
jgi:hypothetical protein